MIDQGNAQKNAERMREIRTKIAIAIPIGPRRDLVISSLLLAGMVTVAGRAGGLVGDCVIAGVGLLGDFIQVLRQIHVMGQCEFPERVDRDFSFALDSSDLSRRKPGDIFLTDSPFIAKASNCLSIGSAVGALYFFGSQSALRFNSKEERIQIEMNVLGWPH